MPDGGYPGAEWTLVRHRRGRARQRPPGVPSRQASPPSHRRLIPVHGNERGNPRFNQQRSYASVLRTGLSLNRDNPSHRRDNYQGYAHGYGPQFFVPQAQFGPGPKHNYNHNKQYNQHYINKQNRAHTQHKKYQNGYNRNFNGANNQNNNKNNETHLDDPDFKIKIKTMHNIIRTAHHLRNVSQTQPPVTLSKTKNTIYTTIKPAITNPDTQRKLWNNALNWEWNTQGILREHYEDTLKVELTKLASLPMADWKALFRIASTHARRRLGRRLLRETVDQAEAQILDAVLSAQPAPEVPTRPGNAPATAGIQPVKTNTKTITSVAVIHAPPPIIQSQLMTPTAFQRPSSPRVTTPPTRATKTTVSTMTEQRGDWSPIMGGVGVDLIPPTPPSPLPREQRIRRVPVSRETVPETPLTQETSGLPVVVAAPPGPPTPRAPQRNNPCCVMGSDSIHTTQADGLDGGQGERIPAPTTPPPPAVRANPTRLTSTVQTRLNLRSTQQKNNIGTPRGRPTRHLNTNRKMQDWSLCVGKKFIVIGDSNVARFPPFNNADLQIDSYPGATFRHAEAILAKTTTSTTVEKVVLSFGINHRSQKFKETAIKQLQSAMREAKIRFPQAQIYIPVLNYSRALPLAEQLNLQLLNRHIVDNYNFIPVIPRPDFATDRDYVHWTHPTASKILTHWMAHLNCSSP